MLDEGSSRGAAAASLRTGERRRNRKLITRLDQELLNRLRSVCSEQDHPQRRIGREQIGELLGIRERDLAGGILRELSGGRGDSLGQSEFRQAVIGLVLAEEEKKLRFVFGLHDGDGDGALCMDDLDAMLEASMRHNRISFSPSEPSSSTKSLVQQLLALPRKSEGSLAEVFENLYGWLARNILPCG